MILSESTIKAVTMATMLIRDADKEYDCVPDYILHSTSKETGLQLADCRLIRDIVQENRG